MLRESPLRRYLSVLAAAASLLLVSVGGFPGSASAATPGDQLWAKRYNGSANGYDSSSSVAVTPDGSEVIVAGQSSGSTSAEDYVTVAYDTATGAKLWLKRYNGPANGADIANAIAVSPDGSNVFVTGQSAGSTSAEDYATVAYDASTGAKVWGIRYNGPGNATDIANAIGISPDGSNVFVTGQSAGSTSASDYATVAYDASTGAKVWEARFNGSANGTDIANAIAVNPDGSRVFVTGQSAGSTSAEDYATVAYDTSTEAKVWVKRYNNAAGNGSDIANAVSVSPDGSVVLVTGTSWKNFRDYATVAYEASNGATLWVRRYDVDHDDDLAQALGVSPDGSTVFVTGTSYDFTTDTGFDYATIAYDVSTGARLWGKRYNGPVNVDDYANALGVSPDGSEVFVTGSGYGALGGGVGRDYTTLAYDASTGKALWVKSYNGSGNSFDIPNALGVNPAGSEVFVTGGSPGSTSDSDYATVAYSVA